MCCSMGGRQREGHAAFIRFASSPSSRSPVIDLQLVPEHQQVEHLDAILVEVAVSRMSLTEALSAEPMPCRVWRT